MLFSAGGHDGYSRVLFGVCWVVSVVNFAGVGW